MALKAVGSNPISLPRKKEHRNRDALFLVIFACGEFYAQVRDIAFGSDMRFARWKLQGEYNITVSVANNITFAK